MTIEKVYKFGGLNLRDTDLNVDKMYATDIKNIDFNYAGELVKRKGYHIDSKFISGSNTISLISYKESNELLAMRSDGLYRRTGESYEKIPQSPTSSGISWDGEVSSVEINGILFVSDQEGKNNVFKYDGNRFFRAGLKSLRIESVLPEEVPGEFVEDYPRSGAMFGGLLSSSKTDVFDNQVFIVGPGKTDGEEVHIYGRKDESLPPVYKKIDYAWYEDYSNVDVSTDGTSLALRYKYGSTTAYVDLYDIKPNSGGYNLERSIYLHASVGKSILSHGRNDEMCVSESSKVSTSGTSVADGGLAVIKRAAGTWDSSDYHFAGMYPISPLTSSISEFGRGSVLSTIINSTYSEVHVAYIEVDHERICRIRVDYGSKTFRVLSNALYNPDTVIDGFGTIMMKCCRYGSNNYLVVYKDKHQAVQSSVTQTQPGALLIYRKAGENPDTSWTYVKTIHLGSNGGPGYFAGPSQLFGYSFDYDEENDVAVVGAPGSDSGLTDRGMAYSISNFFSSSVYTWEEMAPPVSQPETPVDKNFGSAVATLSPIRDGLQDVIVGYPNAKVGVNSTAGSVNQYQTSVTILEDPGSDEIVMVDQADYVVNIGESISSESTSIQPDAEQEKRLEERKKRLKTKTVGDKHYFRYYYTTIDHRLNLINSDYGRVAGDTATYDFTFNDFSNDNDKDFCLLYATYVPPFTDASGGLNTAKDYYTKDDIEIRMRSNNHNLSVGDTVFILCFTRQLKGEASYQPAVVLRFESDATSDIIVYDITNISSAVIFADQYTDANTLDVFNTSSTSNVIIRLFESEDEFFNYKLLRTAADKYHGFLVTPDQYQDAVYLTIDEVSIESRRTDIFMDDIYDTSIIKSEIPKIKYLSSYQNHLIGANIQYPNEVDRVVYRNQMVWSDFSIGGSLETFAPFDFVQIGLNTDRELTSIFGAQDNIVLFKHSRVYFISGLLAAGQYRIRESLSEGIGCVSHNSVVEVSDGALFMSDRGVYHVMGGNKPIELSDANEPLFESTEVDLSKSVSLIDSINERILIYLENEDQASSILMIYDFYFKQWLIYKDIPLDGAIVFHDKKVYVSNGNIVRSHGVSYQDENDDETFTNVSAYYKTGWFDMGMASLRKKFVNIVLFSLSRSRDFIGVPSTAGVAPDFTVTIKPQINWIPTDKESFDMTFNQSKRTDDHKLAITQSKSMRLVLENNLNEPILITGLEIEWENTQTKPKGVKP